MKIQFMVFTVFCSLVNGFALYYMTIFCNIYQKSVHPMFQTVFLTVFLNTMVFDFAMHFINASVRSIIKLFTTKYYILIII